MIQVKNLTITHRKDLRCLVRDFSWVLNPGDKAVLIGEEGNGKSTFLKLLYNEQLVDDYAEYSGEIIKNGETIGYLPQEMPEDARQQERYMKIYQKVEYQQATITRQNPHGGQLLKKKMHAVKSLGRRLERESAQLTEFPESEDAIDLKWTEQTKLPAGKKILEICVSPETMYTKTGKTFAKPLSLEVTGPEKVCIAGANGAGKSTFLKLVAQQLLEREDIHAVYMSQNYEDVLEPEKTPVEFICVSGDREELCRIRTFLGSMKFTPDEMDHACRELSGGQKAKLFFIKMLLSGCNVLILDEPTRNFSPLSGRSSAGFCLLSPGQSSASPMTESISGRCAQRCTG